MNKIKFFNELTEKLLKYQTGPIVHSVERSIPNTNLHCYEGAWRCMNSIISAQKPTDADALDLMRFMAYMCGQYTEELEVLSDYLADTFDINLSFMEL